jgi:oligosaccharide repeat unit polymerase
MIAPPRFTLWWLNPAWCFGLVCGITLLMAYIQDPVDYELYRTLKYVQSWHVMAGGLAILVFITGCFFAKALTSDNVGRKFVNVDMVRRWFHLCVALTIFGYLVWLGVGLKNGATPALFLDVVFSDDTSVIESIRDDYFPTIPGVTTCTQFGLPAILLGLYVYFLGDRKAIRWVGIIVALALVRAILNSERLALIELVLPAVILTVRLFMLPMKNYLWSRRAGIIAPLVAPLMLMLVFGSFEYFRSWHYYVDDFDSYPEFVVWRLSGYYTTSHNNGAMALETNQPRPLPYHTLEPFWKFPGVAASPIGYERLTGLDIEESHRDMLENYGNPELNNGGGLFLPMLDWGLPGATIFWLGYGFLAGALYYSFLRGNLGGLLLYPLIFQSVLDVPRILVICSTRFTPAIVVLVLVVLTAQVSEESQVDELAESGQSLLPKTTT